MRHYAGMDMGDVADPNVSLREITVANRTAVEALAVTAAQADYVTGVAPSLVVAARTPDACPWYRAVYRDETPFGFVMISDGASRLLCAKRLPGDRPSTWPRTGARTRPGPATMIRS